MKVIYGFGGRATARYNRVILNSKVPIKTRCTRRPGRSPVEILLGRLLILTSNILPAKTIAWPTWRMWRRTWETRYKTHCRWWCRRNNPRFLLRKVPRWMSIWTRRTAWSWTDDRNPRSLSFCGTTIKIRGDDISDWKSEQF